MTEGHLDIEVRPALSGGMGIFARKDFAPGDYIHTVEYEREITPDLPLKPELGERAEHCAYPDGKVIARRAIAAGDEVTVDYLINNPGGDSWPCHCGASRCRGMTGTGFFDLPLALQTEYYPLLADWFKARFPDETAGLELHL